jgi:hypothetical protein
MLPKRSNSLVVVVSIINFKTTAMSFVNKNSVVIFLLLLIILVIVYSLHVKYIYLNAEGQKRAVCLARSLVKLHEKEGTLPSDFLKESGFFFGDRRNVAFQLRIKNKSDFEIEYRPRSTWIFQLSEAKSQVLKIYWNEKMNDIRIVSSIELP